MSDDKKSDEREKEKDELRRRCQARLKIASGIVPLPGSKSRK